MQETTQRPGVLDIRPDVLADVLDRLDTLHGRSQAQRTEAIRAAHDLASDLCEALEALHADALAQNPPDWAFVHKVSPVWGEAVSVFLDVGRMRREMLR